MLNELKIIADNVNKMGLIDSSKIKHPFIRTSPGKSDTKVPKFMVYISKTGKVSKVERVDKETWDSFEYYFTDAHNQFPIIKISDILGKVNSEDDLSKAPIDEEKANKAVKKMQRCSESITSILKKDKKTEPMFVISECLSNIEDAVEFVGSIVSKGLALLPKESEDSNEPVQSQIATSFYISMEIDGYGKMGVNPVNYYQTTNAISKALNETVINHDGEKNLTDIFGSKCSQSVVGEIGKLSFGSRAYFYPYSRNVADRSSESYGVNGPNACILSDESKKAIVDSFQFLTSQGKGQYWDVHSNKNKTSTATLVFVPVNKVKIKGLHKIVGMFRASKEEMEKNIQQSEISEKSHSIITALRGEAAYKNDDMAIIMTINIPGNGPSFLEYSEVTGTKALVDFADKWSKGWENHETTYIPTGKGTKKPVHNKIGIDDIRKVINKRWSRSGKWTNEKMKFEICKTDSIIKAFMGNEKYLRQIVKVLSSYHIYLMIDVASRIGDYDKSKGGKNKPFDLKKARLDIFRLPVIFGEILYQLGIKKEEYEKSLPYMIGQIFASSNRLQKEVMSERMSILPRDFHGSKHIHLALNNPQGAINFLLKDMHSYLAVSKTSRKIDFLNGEKSKEYYPYYLFTQASKVIAESEFPEEWTNEDLMLIALGYFQNK